MKSVSLFFLVLMVVFTGLTVGAEEAKPKAADLVSDGQLIDLNSPRYKGLFKELRLSHGFSNEELEPIFNQVTIKRRVLELMDKQWEAKPYHQYRPLFITKKVIKEGKKKKKLYKELLDSVEKKFGVEQDVVLAIWGIETRFGKTQGSFNLFQTLNTMFDAYPRRSNFYRKQLIAYLLLCRENRVDPLSIMGSYGGAFGQTQFIPSSFREYAVDFDGDGKRDVWRSVPDVLASIANYLANFHWTHGAPVYRDLGAKLKDDRLQEAYAKGRKGFLPWELVAEVQQVKLEAPPEDRKLTIVGLEKKNGTMRYVAGYPNFQAITKWNNSNRYAMAVSELAEKIRD